MNEIILSEKNDQVLVNSRELAKKFGKQNKHVNETIRSILKSTPQMEKHFKKSTYKSKRGRIENCYDLDEVALNILNIKYKYSSMNPRFEIKFKNLLYEMFPNEKIIPQYHILDYRIDFFMPDLHMIIEYDEDHHKYQKENDDIRMKDILNELNRMIIDGEPLYDGDSSEPNHWMKSKKMFSVIRIEKGKEIDGLRRLCIEITENMMTSCSNYMK